jgi:AraC-like DNA-binding protein
MPEGSKQSGSDFWEHYDPSPSITLSGRNSGWDVDFHEAEYGAAGGEWDVLNTAIHLASNTGPSRQFWGSRQGPVQLVQPGSCLKLPGQRCVGGWRSAMTVRHLLVGTHQFEMFLGEPFRSDRIRPCEPAVHNNPQSESRIIDQILEALAYDLRDGSPAGPVFAQTAVCAVLRRLVGSPARSSSRPVLGQRDGKVRRALEQIHANLGARITLLDIAGDLNVSVQYLCRAFKRDVGMTPYQYIITQKVKFARDLLIHSDLSLSQIALRSGFNDQSQMSTRLKRVLGISPSQLREDRARGGGESETSGFGIE